jgi:hypothetical protein
MATKTAAATDTPVETKPDMVTETVTTHGVIVKPEEGGALVTADELNFEADANVGAETMGKDDLAMPFLVILQDLSPQTKKSKPEYIPGAQPGMFLNTVTGELWPGEQGLIFINALYQRTFIEWVPKDAGGGFVADHGLAAGQKLADRPDTKRDNGTLILANGNTLVDTAYHFGLIVNEETGEGVTALLTMKSTGLKVSRKWNAQAMGIKLPGQNGRTFTPALAYMAYKLVTKEVSNDKGTWSELVVTPYMATPKLKNGTSLYRQAIDFAKMMATAPLPIDRAQEQSDLAASTGAVDGDAADAEKAFG